MKNQDIKIDLGKVQETLMLPLWARAREAEKDNPIVCDTYAKNIIGRIDYDFSQIEESHMADNQGVWAIRAYNFDNIVIIEEHPMLARVPARNDFTKKEAIMNPVEYDNNHEVDEEVLLIRRLTTLYRCSAMVKSARYLA